MNIADILPELSEISDPILRTKVEKSLEKAIKAGGWAEADLAHIPFTLLIPKLVNENNEPQVSIIDHIQAVTKLSIMAYETYEKLGYSDHLNRDEIIAGALLHDVGKFVEYERDTDGKIVQSEAGRILRHPAQGLALVEEFDLPLAVRQSIVFHSKEGDQIYRLPEVEIVSRSDFICFIPLKKIHEKR
jgi:putative nucleotidyltransferase with HDIG domain